MKTVIVTGSQGFIGSFLCEELLNKGYNVVGIDNFSKYGRVSRPHDRHSNFTLLEADLAYLNKESLLTLFNQFSPDYIIAGAAMIGGISYFHKYAYDLLATNERILANTLDMAIDEYKNKRLKRLVVISSSMVFEGADTYDTFTVPSLLSEAMKPWPSQERMVNYFPPPYSTYGFQKLSSEYFCKGANEQYGLPYTIVRPFNCVGLGEEDAIGEEAVMSGNVKLLMSHVLPDLVNKVLKGQDPLHILGNGSQIRCYTHGKDIARGIVMAMESEQGLNEDFNISTSRETTVLELAEIIWKHINGDKPLRIINDEPYTYDVQKRIPDVSKAKELLGFEAQIPLEQSVAEVVEHMRNGTSSKRTV